MTQQDPFLSWELKACGEGEIGEGRYFLELSTKEHVGLTLGSVFPHSLTDCSLSFVHSCIHSFTYLLIHSLIGLFNLLTDSSTWSLIHLLTYLLLHSRSGTFIHSPGHVFVHSFTCLFIHSFSHFWSCIDTFPWSLTDHSLTHSHNQLLPSLIRPPSGAMLWGRGD